MVLISKPTQKWPNSLAPCNLANIQRIFKCNVGYGIGSGFVIFFTTKIILQRQPGRPITVE